MSIFNHAGAKQSEPDPMIGREDTARTWEGYSCYRGALALFLGGSHFNRNGIAVELIRRHRRRCGIGNPPVCADAKRRGAVPYPTGLRRMKKAGVGGVTKIGRPVGYGYRTAGRGLASG